MFHQGFVEDETRSSGDGLRLEWSTSEWSRCSQTCGKDGKQVGGFWLRMEKDWLKSTYQITNGSNVGSATFTRERLPRF